MTRSARRTEEPLLALLSAQHGVVSRDQLVGIGWTRDQIKAALATEWTPVLRGVYLAERLPLYEVGPGTPSTTFERLDDRARVWAGLRYAGAGAVASHGTALWLGGARWGSPPPVEITIPEARRVKEVPGLRIHRLSRLPEPCVGSPPRTRIEEATLDATDRMSKAREVVGLVLHVVQARLTTAARLRVALSGRYRHHWRLLLEGALADAETGVASVLEREYLLRVERAHGLPSGDRNRPERVAGGNRYRDVHYPRYRTVVELEGREWHPAEESWRDRRRDNRVTVLGDASLRYGWGEVAGEPCEVAREVGDVLGLNGWRQRPKGCGPTCPLA